MRHWIALFTVTIGLCFAASARADDNVREVQTKLSDEGFYFGQIDGAYSSDLSAALSRYQIRKGLPITGQLDAETSKSLGAKPAVGPSTAGTEQGSETWRRLRKGEPRTSANVPKTSSPRTDEAAESTTETRPPPAAAAKSRTSAETTEPVSVPPATSSESTRPASAPPPPALDTGSPVPELSTERLRDYVAAFVLAGLDKNVAAETRVFCRSRRIL